MKLTFVPRLTLISTGPVIATVGGVFGGVTETHSPLSLGLSSPGLVNITISRKPSVTVVENGKVTAVNLP